MKHLISYKMFETKSPPPKTPQRSAPETPKINVDGIGQITGKKDDNSTSAAVGNWFERLGSKIEELGGPIVKDPLAWRKGYKGKLDGLSAKTADGKTVTVNNDSGFSDIVGGGVAMTKGILGKALGSPKDVKMVNKPYEDIQHQRLFHNNNKQIVDRMGNVNDLDKWADQKYREAGLNPGESKSFDQSIQSIASEWFNTAPGKAAIPQFVEGAATTGTASRLATGAAEIAPFVI